MIHVLFTELKNLLKMIMKQFIKSDTIDGISAKTLLGLERNSPSALLLENVEFGGKTARLLAKLTVSDQQREKEKMLAFYYYYNQAA